MSETVNMSYKIIIISKINYKLMDKLLITNIDINELYLQKKKKMKKVCV